MWVAFANAHIFCSKNISVYAIFDEQRFNDTLINDIVSFEQLDPGNPVMVDILFDCRTVSRASGCSQLLSRTIW